MRNPPWSNPTLEAKLGDDAASWQVYGDWLLERGEDWGAVINRVAAGASGPSEQEELEDELLGDVDGAEVSWKHGVIDSLLLAPEETPDEPQGEAAMGVALARILAHPAGRLVRSLTLGLPPCAGGKIEWNFDGMMKVLADAGPLPRLAVLDLSRDAEHMDQPSWRRVGDLGALWATAPHLRELALQGARGSDPGPPILFGAIEAPLLEKIVFQSGGLDAHAPEAIGAAHLPSLRHLELWFGSEEYGNTCSLESLSGILAGNGLPALTTLGLRNSEWEADLVEAIALSAVLGRLRRLDLSMGVLSRDGVAALLEHADVFRHLETIALDDNFILDEDGERLVAELPNVDLGVQREPDGDIDDDYSRYPSVTE